MTTRPTPHIEHAVARLQPQVLDQEPDLVPGPLGERIPQVGLTQVISYRLEPMP